MISCPERNAYLAGLVDSTVLAVPEGAHSRLIAVPGVADAIVDGLLAALQQRQENLRNATGPHHERLRAKLFQLAREHGRVTAAGVEIALPLTHQLLADMIGCSRETVTGILSRFQDEDLVTRDDRGRYLLAIDPQALEPASSSQG